MLQSDGNPENASWLPGAQLNIAEAALAGVTPQLTIAAKLCRSWCFHLKESQRCCPCIHGVRAAGGDDWSQAAASAAERPTKRVMFLQATVGELLCCGQQRMHQQRCTQSAWESYVSGAMGPLQRCGALA